MITLCSIKGIAYQESDSLLAGKGVSLIDTLNNFVALNYGITGSQLAKTLADISAKIYANQSAKHFANLKRGEFTPFNKDEENHLCKGQKSAILQGLIWVTTRDRIEFFESIKKGNHKDDEFTPIKGFEDYLINKSGQLISIKFNKIKKLNPSLDVYGYEKVTLSMNGKPKSCLVHRLVAETFLLNPQNKRDVNHLNGDKTDNRLCNLEWATPKENTEHAWATGLNNSRFKPIKQLDINGKLIRTFKSAKDAESVLSICRGDIAKVCKGKQKSAGGYKWSYL
ncbi:HNH endonuclease [Proteus terrae]|uniref:HNH endonuclease n=1 Tax=Proteus terrae TaxID=1574161 RepID=UPI0032DA0EC3